jgi:hypothetical protein
VIFRRLRGTADAEEKVKAKRAMAWIAREDGGFTNQERAKVLRQHPAALSSGIAKLSDELSKTPSYAVKLRKGKSSVDQLSMPDRISGVKKNYSIISPA